MTELPDPIDPLLKDTADEERVRRIWKGIGEKQQRKRGPSAGAKIAAVSVLAAAAALLVYVVWAREDAPAPVAHGPLRLENGEPFAAREGDLAIELSDRSRIELRGARIEPLRNDGDTITLLLARGSARFEVEPGGPRTWTIESGVATVEVVGTVFTVTRGDGWARVEVEHGTVVVRGERVRDRAARLTAGESLLVGEEQRASAPAPIEPPPAEPPQARRPPPDAEALMVRADEARRAGDLEQASVLLERAAARNADPAAGVAAFTLGRLELDSRHRPDRAARAFARALSLTLPARMREDASARLVEAHRRTGDAAAADRAARAYLADYPEGRHAARVREALADP